MKSQLEQVGFLMPRHPLNSFETKKHYQNEPQFNGFYSRNNLPMKNTKVKVGDLVRIQKYKNIFAKGYIPNWSEEVFGSDNVRMRADVRKSM